MNINVRVTLIYHLKFTKFRNNKLRTVPHGAVREVRLVRIFITRTNVPYRDVPDTYPVSGAF